MIIFYDKETKAIFSVIEGRYHPNADTMFITVTGKEQEQVGKYIVPYKDVMVEGEEPIIKFKLIDPRTQEVKPYQAGVKKIMVKSGTTPDVPFADLIIAFEKAEEDIYKYRVVTDGAENVIGFEKIV